MQVVERAAAAGAGDVLRATHTAACGLEDAEGQTIGVGRAVAALGEEEAVGDAVDEQDAKVG